MVTGESLLESKQPEENKLDAFTTKVAQNTSDAGNMTAVDLHKQHFHQTMQALEKITRDFSPAPTIEVLAQQVGLVYLPPPERPEEQRKVAIFDMDETLIHCVDDIEKENPEVLLEIDFSPNQDGSNPEDIVCAGINIRPYIIECLEEAAKNFQVIVFTASHQTYADAILDYIDPDHRLISYRMYRQHCYLTPENYYIKDLRVIANRDLKDMVLVDNSVFSFAYQLENGVPIVSFYRQPPQDEEMLHLIYYLSVLGGVNDVRTQNVQAFELHKLAGLQPPQFEEEAGQVEGDEEQDFQEIPEVTNESDYDSIRK
ncbi:hypothetical protein FGO68_gene4802 [Halteria grandinella]|uniref:FCP1 homology domain-containing protein n=1 Tax=Halteria grandinella TaxID=5974 RepID=A0A8J8SU81_HALGN|nr:hypothetical protein FGO68_gene4802 [Halteria grandinella]